MSLVPPPPPETPSLLSYPLGGQYYSQQLVPLELLSPESLTKRQDQLKAHLTAAKKELADKEDGNAIQKDRVKQFDALFEEGVISRKELQLSHDELKTSQADIDTVKSKIEDLQSALNRVTDKVKI